MFDIFARKYFQRLDVKLDNLITIGANIMSAISDFAAQQAIYNAAMDAAVADIVNEIQSLNAEIAALQASPGVITPADQALLDGIQAHSQAMSAKLAAMDSLTPPVVPVVPPVA